VRLGANDSTSPASRFPHRIRSGGRNGGSGVVGRYFVGAEETPLAHVGHVLRILWAQQANPRKARLGASACLTLLRQLHVGRLPSVLLNGDVLYIANFQMCRVDPEMPEHPLALALAQLV